MEFNIPAPCRIKAIDAGIIQNVGAIATLSPQSKIIDVRLGPALEDRDEFVFRTVETTLAGIGLVPDQKIFPFRIKGKGGTEQLMKVTPVHEDIVDSSATAGADRATDEAIEEGPESRRRHLAGGHRKFSMAHLAAAHSVTLDLNVVGWVGHHHLSELALQQPFVSLAVPGITADQAMAAQRPNVTKLGNRRSFRTKTRQVIGWISRKRLLRTVYQQVDFAGRKVGELDIEIKFDQILEMATQQIKIPYSLLGQAIVSDHHRPLLGCAQAADRDGRDFRHAQASCRFPPPVACENGACLID